MNVVESSVAAVPLPAWRTKKKRAPVSGFAFTHTRIAGFERRLLADVVGLAQVLHRSHEVAELLEHRHLLGQPRASR